MDEVNNENKVEEEITDESGEFETQAEDVEAYAEEPVDLSSRINELEMQLAERKKEYDKTSDRAKDYNTMYVRLQADFDNYKKRTNEQIKKMKDEGAAEVISKVIPVIDVIGTALKMITDEKVAEGVNMINRQLLETLTSFGVTEIPALGKPFDPELHNAILQVDAENPDMEGLVIEVFQKGYRMGDRILRHSVVKVAK